MNDTLNSMVTMRPDDYVLRERRFAKGDEILGRYVVESELGQGGMGVVYQCFDKVGGVEVAVKGLPPEVSHNSDEMESVRENFQLVSGLSHPNIAGLRTLERDDATGNHYLVMTLARGVSLKKWMKRHAGAEHRAEQLAVLRQVAAALDYAHAAKPRRVIHRDIKPENVMVDDEGAVLVLDFGLAAQVRSSLSRVSQVVTSSSGTPAYKSPEQWLAQPQRAAADQYSLAVIAYQMFAGELPFDGDLDDIRHAVVFNPVPVIDGESKAINAVFAKALAKRPDDRFASCADFVAALEGKGGTRTPSIDPFGLLRRGIPVASAFVGLAAALALAVGGIWWWQGRDGNGTGGTPAVISRVPDVPLVPDVPVRPPAPKSVDKVNDEVAAELPARMLASQMETASQLIARESDEVRAFFEVEIRAFETLRKAGDKALADKSCVAANKLFTQAKAKADALKELVTARASCLTAKERAEAAKRSADAVDAKSTLPLRYEEAEKALGQVKSLAEKRDFAAASARAEAAQGQFAALRADIVKTTLDAAKWHKTAERWEQCLAAAEKVLAWEPQNAAAAALKSEAESHLQPSLRMVAKIGNREVAATATINGKAYKSTWVWDKNVKPGSRIPSSDIAVEYSEGGKRYVGTMKPVTVDWKGSKTVEVALTEYKGPKLGDTKTITLPGGAKMEMVWCPAGSFMMGSPTSEENRDSDETQHKVTLTQGFWMGKYEVTQAQWESVMGSNPSNFKGANRPVEMVSWDDCQAFIRKINAAGQVTVALPTEAQWEYACRAGATTSLPNGRTLRVLGVNNGPALDEIAWYGGNSSVGFELSDGWDCSGWPEKQYSGSKAGTHPVGQKKPNDWGLYDMIGNVWEWCSDWYGNDYYAQAPLNDPQGPASGTYRVYRGGSWYDSARYCRSASRVGDGPGDRGGNLGLRLVCSAGPRR